MKLAVFSGTADGRMLCGLLSEAGVSATVCVATEYGRDIMPDLAGITVRAGRMDASGIAEFLRDYDTIVDATHPYAVEISEKLESLCADSGIRYLRVVRPETGDSDELIRVASAREAAEYLNGVTGNALITTGSKELVEFVSVRGFEQRLYARVLPDPDIVKACTDLGFRGERLICMQGPFSHDMNTAMLEMTKAKYLITKDSGAAGGLPQKLSAARERGISVILISRPKREEGYSISEIVRLLTEDPNAVVGGDVHIAPRDGDNPRDGDATPTNVTPQTDGNTQIHDAPQNGNAPRTCGNPQANDAPQNGNVPRTCDNTQANDALQTDGNPQTAGGRMPPLQGIPRFPLFVSIKGKECVVVGGGTVACRRARVLRDFGAKVSLIAPEIKERISGVTYYERKYCPEDAFKAFIVVAATDNREVNHAVAKDFGRYHVQISVADCPEESTFFFPAVYNGKVVAGVISRDGDHKLAAEAARRVRAALEDL